MKKSMKRTLSLLLALTMVLSLGLPAYAVGAPAEEAAVIADEEPVELPAEEPVEEPVEEPIEEPVEKPVTLPIGAGKKIGFTEEEEIVSEDLIVDIVNEESVVEEEAAPAKDFYYSESATGFTVEVSAPAGALPLGTEMVVDRLVDLSSVQNAVDRAENLNGSVQLAADISFWLNGEEIEPAEGTKLFVRMSAPEIEGIADPVVIHVPDGENAVPEIVEQMSAGDIAMANSVEFETSSFSVYAVIGGETHDEARLLVKYKQADGSSEVSYYVKKSDINVETIDGVEYDRFKQVVYDPGVGTVPEGKMFLGWCKQADYTASTVAMTIDDVRDDIKALLNAGVKEGDSVTYYPIILNVRFVSYLDELGASIKNDVIKFQDGDSVPYTIKQAYTPREQDSHFDGWAVARYNATTKQYEATDTLYDNNTQITITKESENLVLIASVPRGHWLIFKENGSGATYTQPQFILSEGTATEPTPPTRTGYTFAGWFEGEPAQTGGDPTGAQFTAWNSTLSESKTLYAKWTVNANAPYTVVIWLQKVEGDKYDFKQSVRLTGSTTSANNPVTKMGTGTTDVRDDYARINNTNYQYEGFHLADYPTNVTISPTGTTVVNVYYDRNVYTITFQANRNQDYSYYSQNLYQASSPRVTVHTVEARYQGSLKNIWTFTGSNGESFPHTDSWKTSWLPAGSSTYTARVSRIETMPAEDLTFIAMRSNKTTRYFHYYVEALPTDTNTRTFNGKKYVLYTDLTHDYQVIVYNDDFWLLDGFTREAIATSGGTNVTSTIKSAGSDGVEWQNGWQSNLYFYYTRDKYPILYKDGRCYDGKNPENYISTEENLGNLGESEMIAYNLNLADYDTFVPTREGYVFEGWYLDDACNTKFVFAENTMPKGGITLYAKWKQVEYRVFLHPNVDEATEVATYPNPEDQFSMGGQATSFRLSYGDTITQPVPVRKEYEPVGWYMSYDPATDEYSNAWNFDFVGNDINITTKYNKTEETELTTPYGTVEAGQEGVNKDKTGYNGGDRFWITKKLDLYLKWRLKLTGAQGIQVYYDAVEGTGEGTGKFADNTTLMYDPVGYYTDSAIAVAQGASIANSEKEEFKYWVLQKWDATANNGEGAYVDTETTVLPGATFKISKLDAREEQIDGADPEHDLYWLTYKIQLRAEYGSIEAPTPTHINWYSNIYDAAGNPLPDPEAVVATMPTAPAGKEYTALAFDSQKGYGFEREGVEINIGIEIPEPATFTLDGYTFLGWGRVNSTEAAADAGNSVPGLTKAAAPSVENPSQLSDENLFLKWVPNRDGETGHYEAQKPDGEWTAVTQVAADENTPYMDLYAVWSGEFYVVHSGVDYGTDGKPVTETYYINRGNNEFNLLKKHQPVGDSTTSVEATNESSITPNYLYGGYYLTASSTDRKAYDGTNWTFSDPQTVDASRIHPVGGTTYYIKEVPGNTGTGVFESNYLKAKLTYTYFKQGDGQTFDQLGSMWLVSKIDDQVGTAYKEAGFIINGTQHAAICSTSNSVTIRAADDDGPGKTYSGPGAANRIMYLNVFTRAKRVNDDNPVDEAVCILKDGETEMNVNQYWITNDGYLVTGYTLRKTTNFRNVGDKPTTTVINNDSYSCTPVTPEP